MMSFEVHTADCLQHMRTMADNAVDAVVTDPPYGLTFMGKDWDKGVPGEVFWREALRVSKPGAHLLAFGGTRTFHRLTCAIEDAGWEIRDCIMWVYGSGFPKSLDVSKAIDKAAGAEREVVGKKKPRGGMAATFGGSEYRDSALNITAPATDLARQWQGWGTCLKPAFEPIILARKPLDGTVAGNVAKWGTGGLNVDGCRVAADQLAKPSGPQKPFGGVTIGKYNGGNERCSGSGATHPSGRFPANLVHDGSEEVLAGFPVTGPSKAAWMGLRHSGRHGGLADKGGNLKPGTDGIRGHNDLGGSAARFFYCAKASRGEREAGLDRTCSVKYNIDRQHIGGLSCKDAATVLVQSLRRVTSGLTTRWNTGESGESIMGLCPLDSLYTTLTAISRITTSEILNSLPPLSTSESIAGASCGTASGGSLAENVENSSPLSPATTSAETGLAHGVSLAASEMLLTISEGANWKPMRNVHSTVKPISLMRWLVRLVTPPDGLVLDPFTGSGTTGCAAVLEGKRFIGCELNAEYAEIARARIAHHAAQGVLELEAAP